MAQAKKLTDAQIDATYDHFENGAKAPAGVVLAATFTRTMGRYVYSDKNGTRVLEYA